MASFGQDFLKGFFGSDTLKDYRHASKTFLNNGAELLPRQKFLFHVYFNLNVEQIPALKSMFAGTAPTTVGLMVKTIDLPSYEIDVDTLNQYNRKRLVQKKIEYNPVRMVFNDDGGDLVRKLWYNYFSYYYKDPAYPYDGDQTQTGANANANRISGFSYNNRMTYSNDRLANDWGYIAESQTDGAAGKPPFFKDIRVYGMSQKRYAEYILVNPMIKSWQHDTYDYSSSEAMTHNVTVNYETVKYREGVINGATGAPLVGFAQPDYYDKEPSALGRAGGTASILGPGGLLESGAGIINDLQNGDYLSAIRNIGSTAQTFKGKDLAAIARSEAKSAATSVLRSTTNNGKQAANTRGGFAFPTPPTTTPTNNSASAPVPFIPGNTD